jgi:hypothetical protein
VTNYHVVSTALHTITGSRRRWPTHPAYARIAGSRQTVVSILRYGTDRSHFRRITSNRTQSPFIHAYIKLYNSPCIYWTLKRNWGNALGDTAFPTGIPVFTRPTRVCRCSRGGNGRLPMKVIRTILFFGSSNNGPGIEMVSTLHTSSTSMDNCQGRPPLYLPHFNGSSTIKSGHDHFNAALSIRYRAGLTSSFGHLHS